MTRRIPSLQAEEGSQVLTLALLLDIGLLLELLLVQLKLLPLVMLLLSPVRLLRGQPGVSEVAAQGVGVLL